MAQTANTVCQIKSDLIQLNSAHYAPLDAAEVAVMRAAIGLAAVAEDIRHFQTGRHGLAGSGRLSAKLRFA
jgi:hypothetical protein